jgi:hypothetical protein
MGSSSDIAAKRAAAGQVAHAQRSRKAALGRAGATSSGKPSIEVARKDG